jgi:ACS family hexuronate transporter-like MFS transporter
MTASESRVALAGVSGARAPRRYFRWFICLLLFLSTTFNYMDRQIIGILKSTLNTDFHWNEHDYANIVTAFQFAYAFGYLFAGRMMDRLGVKFGLPLVVALWSVAAAAHGLVSLIDPTSKVNLLLMTVPTSVLAFSVLRLALGIFEGGNFPASIKAVTEWFPIKERALSTGLFNAGTTFGAIFCPLLVPPITHWFGWPAAFYATGGLGLAWIVLWMLTYDSPAKHPRLSAEEREYIESDAPVAVEKTEVARPAIPWAKLLTYRATWAYVVGMALTSPVWWFYLFWIPDFLEKKFHLTQDTVGFPVGVIYFMTLFGSVLGGWLPSLLLSWGLSLNASRKISLLIPALCAIPVALAPLAPGLWTAVFFLGFAASAHQAWSANLYTIVSDTMPKESVSSVIGIGGLVAGLAAMAASQAVGYILDATGSYYVILTACCIMYPLAVTIMHLLVPRIRPVEATGVAAE